MEQNTDTIYFLKKAYFEETYPKEILLIRIKGIDMLSREKYYVELSKNLKISNGKDLFSGYKMYEYLDKNIVVIDKVFDEIKGDQKVPGKTYIFPSNLKIDLEKLAKNHIMNEINTNKTIQIQNHCGNYYENIKEKMERAELEGLLIEERELSKGE